MYIWVCVPSKHCTIILLYTKVCVFSNHCTIVLIHTKVSAPSKPRLNYNHCNPNHGAPSRRALHGVEIPHLRRCRGLASLHRKHQPFNIAERKATRLPQQLLNLSPRKERSEWSKIKFFASLSFKKASRRRPPVKKPQSKSCVVPLSEAGGGVAFEHSEDAGECAHVDEAAHFGYLADGEVCTAQEFHAFCYSVAAQVVCG